MDARFEFDFGPAYIRFPKCLDGQVFGSMHDTVVLDIVDKVPIVLAALHVLDAHRLLDTIPSEFGSRAIEIQPSPAYSKTVHVWSTIAEPALFFSDVVRGNEPSAREGLAQRLKSWAGAVAQGHIGVHETHATARVCVRLVRVTAAGIEVSVQVRKLAGVGMHEKRIELRWDNFWRSAAQLAAKHGG